MTITEMRQKRANTWDAAKKFLDEHRGENGLLSAEDNATYEKMEADVTALTDEIKRMERAEALDRQLAEPVSTALKAKPGQPEDKTGRASDEYKRAFDKVLRNKSVPYEVYNALETGEDSEGGYLVPDEFEHQLVEALQDVNAFRGIARVIQTASGDRKIPVVSAEGTASWIDEEGEITDTDTTFGQVTLGAYKLATLMKVSEELLRDSVFNLDAYIAGEFARRIGNEEEKAFMIGNGSGKPTGIFDATGGGSVGVTAASETAITADEVLDLFYSLKAPYRTRATWVLNDATIKAIRKLKDGSGQYLWQPSLVAGQPDMILNRPFITSAYAPTMAKGARAIALGDFGYYWIADRQGRSMKRLNELYAVTGQVGFLATQRVDGKPILAEAIKVLKMKP